MAPRGLGDLWGGKKNRGFLDEQTQKLIVTRQVPKYVDNSIPGISSIKVGLGSMTWDEDEDVEHMGKALRRSKWMGIKQDDSFGNTLDDIDPELSDAFRDEIEQEKKRSFDDKFSNEGLLIEEDYRPKPTDQNTFDATFQIKPANAVLLEGIDREQEDAFGRALVDDSEDSGLPIEQYSVAKHQSDLIREHEEKYALDDFARAMPPGLPQNRIEKLRRVFESNLGYPNMLELIPLLRENMPERPPLSWLQKKNLQNAHFVMNRMQEKDLFNTTKSLNTALQVTATSNKLEKALSFHDIEFSRRGLKPDQFSDGIIIQMLLRNKRAARALQFKEKVEEEGRQLDLHSYGSFVQHFANHDELGSAMMFIKECISVHTFPPAEGSISKVRLLCRQRNLNEKLQIESLLGPDPLEWLRRDKMYKRDRSTKGMKGIKELNNMFL